MNVYEELLLNQNEHVRALLKRGPMILSIELDDKPTDVLLRDGMHACIDLWGQYLTVEVHCTSHTIDKDGKMLVWTLAIQWTPINWKGTKPHWSSHGTLFLPTKLVSYQCPNEQELIWAGDKILHYRITE